MEPVLYLVRHGRTTANSEDVFRGVGTGSHDFPLSKDGIGDALQARNFLKEKQIDPLFLVSSDRKRARQTAHIVAEDFPDDIITSPKLRAWDIGDFTGEPRSKENLEELQKYIDNPYLEVPGGESLDVFKSRVLPTIHECFEYACQTGIGFIICHSSVIHELGRAIHDDHNSLIVEPGGVVLLGFEDGKPTAKPVFKRIKPAPNAESIS